MTINNSYVRRLINLVFELKGKGYQGIAHLTKDYFLITLRFGNEPVVIEKCVTGKTKIKEVEQLIKDLEKLNK
jgi:hypothetical protein